VNCNSSIRISLRGGGATGVRSSTVGQQRESQKPRDGTTVDLAASDPVGTAVVRITTVDRL
jgi:hypothetical protein